MSYPKWLYHKTEQPKLVQTKEEHEALIGHWEETPAAFDKESPEKVSEPKESDHVSEKSPEEAAGIEHKEKRTTLLRKKPKGDQ